MKKFITISLLLTVIVWVFPAQSRNAYATFIDGFIYAEDTAHTSGDDGVFSLGIIEESATTTDPFGTQGDYAGFTLNPFGWLRTTNFAATTTADLDALEIAYDSASEAATSQDVNIGGFRRCALSFTIDSNGTSNHNFTIQAQVNVGGSYFVVRNSFLQRWVYEDTGTASPQNEYVQFPRGCPESELMRIRMVCNANCTATNRFDISNVALHMTN